MFCQNQIPQVPTSFKSLAAGVSPHKGFSLGNPKGETLETKSKGQNVGLINNSNLVGCLLFLQVHFMNKMGKLAKKLFLIIFPMNIATLGQHPVARKISSIATSHTFRTLLFTSQLKKKKRIIAASMRTTSRIWISLNFYSQQNPQLEVSVNGGTPKRSKWSNW